MFIPEGYNIISYVIGFAGPTRFRNTLNSIDNNQKYCMGHGAYSLVTEALSYDIASNGVLWFLSPVDLHAY